MATILYLTDLYYQAQGRNYYEEDLFLTGRLKDHFDLLLAHPQQALSFLQYADLIAFRNTGPVMGYKAYFAQFVQAVQEQGILTFNSFDGKADMKGKDYLLQLTREGFPVIPTVERLDELAQLGTPEKYIVKLKDGADSIGMQVLAKEELLQITLQDQLIQPFIPFVYEVSFYYLNNRFQYALYAPDREKRWDLKAYAPTEDDLAFAQRFIQWNNMARGIVRVDACRLPDGRLLLVELEDLNPFLSLDALNLEAREGFVSNFINALKSALA